MDLRGFQAADWPKPADDASNVWLFWLEFDDTASLADGGPGASDCEMLTIVKSCVAQARAGVSGVARWKAWQACAHLSTPGEVLRGLRDLTVAFPEALLLQCCSRDALLWQPCVARLISEMRSAGIGSIERWLYRGYLDKCGADMRRIVFENRHECPEEVQEVAELRGDCAWTEAYAILLEEEAMARVGEAHVVIAVGGLAPLQHGAPSPPADATVVPEAESSPAAGASHGQQVKAGPSRPAPLPGNVVP